MKIVIDVRMINMSGIGRYVQALMPALIDNFSNITLLGVPIEIGNFEWSDRIKVIEFKNPIYSIGEQIEFLKKVPQCDVFISPHYNVPIYLPQAKKTVVIIPDTNHLFFAAELSLAKRIYAKLFYKIAISKDLIFTISDFSKSEIIRFTNCDPNKIIVAKCAIDKQYFRNLDHELTANKYPTEFHEYNTLNYILYIGNIKPHKNLKRALLAFEEAAIQNPDLRFLIVGKRDNFLTADNEIFRLVDERENLKQKVKFTGHVSDLFLAFLYKRAKLFLFPSLYEGFGLPPLEAMIFGCPVIVSKEGSLPEICGDAVYYCDAYDVKNISKAIDKLLSDEVLRKSLIIKGLSKVEEYDWAFFNNSILNGLTERFNMMADAKIK
jgi:glycosyltransferase involved in cell wall biosynthesis